MPFGAKIDEAERYKSYQGALGENQRASPNL